MSDTIKIWDDDGPDGKTVRLEIEQGGNLDLYLRIIGEDWAGKRLVSDGFRASTSGAKCGLVTSCVALLGAIGRGDRAHAQRIVDGMRQDLERGWSRLPNESHESRASALRREPDTMADGQLNYPCVHCGCDTTEPLLGACETPECVARRGPLISEHPDGRYADYEEVEPLALALTDDDARRLVARIRQEVGDQ